MLIFCNIILQAQNMRLQYSLHYKPYTNDTLKLTKFFVLQKQEEKSLFIEKNKFIKDSLNASEVELSNIYEFTFLRNEKIGTNYKILEVGFDKYKINIEQLKDWKIHNEFKNISGYECQKATIEYGGRFWTAWFSKSIYINSGPYIFANLPGLIFSVSDQAKDYQFDLIHISNLKKELHQINFDTTKYYEINWIDYKKILNDFYSNPLRGFQYIESLKDNVNFRNESEKIKNNLKKNNPIEISQYPNF